MARGEQTIRLLKSLKGFEDILKPYRKNFSYPTFDSKGNLDFNEISSDPSWNGFNYKRAPATVYSGRLFENIAVSMFGGKLNDEIHLIGENSAIKPDIKYSDKHFAEVKSCVLGNPLKLEKEQLSKYAYNLISDGMPIFDFYFFVHNAQGIIKNYSDRESLVDQIRKNIVFAVSTPFVIPVQFFNHPSNNPFILNQYPSDGTASRGYGDRDLLSISSKFLKQLFFDTQRTLNKLNLGSKDFEFKEYNVKGHKVNKKIISEFPFLQINMNSLDYIKWFQQEKPHLEELSQIHLENLEKRKSLEKIVEPNQNKFPWETDEGDFEEELF